MKQAAPDASVAVMPELLDDFEDFLAVKPCRSEGMRYEPRRRLESVVLDSLIESSNARDDARHVPELGGDLPDHLVRPLDVLCVVMPGPVK